MYYRSNQKEAVDALCNDCTFKTEHDYLPWEDIPKNDEEICCVCNLPICAH